MPIALSIIIPVYNVSEFLEYGFLKLLPLYDKIQENEFEVLYINDGSTDNSLNLLTDIKSRKNNIHVINQQNQGLSGARNTGIKSSRGEYICFLDADDYLDIQNFEKVFEIAKKYGTDLTSYRLLQTDEDYNVIREDIKQPIPYHQVMSGRDILIKGYSPNSSCLFLYKSSLLKNKNLFFVKNILHEDEEFMSRVMIAANRVIFNDIFVYFYLQRQGSIMNPDDTSKLEKLLWDEIIVANLIKSTASNLKDQALKIAIEKNYNSIIWNLIWRLYKCKNEISYEFKTRCLTELKNKELYPIQGSLKTNFQKITTILFNQLFILKNILLK